MWLVLLGPPGSGKGTQAEGLAARLGYQSIATGDLLRSEVRRETPLGREAKQYMDKGELVPDEVILAMLAERIPKGGAGVIFDGFPRTVAQAQGLDQVGQRLGGGVTLAVKLDVPDEEIIRRLAARRLCPACGTSYNTATQPPRTPGCCDRCGAALVSRNDDLPEVVAHRLAVYRRETAQVEEYYQQRGLLRTVNGNRPRAEVERALEALVAECKKQAVSPPSRP